MIGRLENRRQKTEGRRQKAEGKRQKAEGKISFKIETVYERFFCLRKIKKEGKI